jgi:thiamine biosynthesis lipoprotein
MNESLHRFSHEAMNTTFEVIVDGEDEAYARSAAEAVFREVDRMETILSRFDPGSDIAQINRLPAGGAVRVGVEVYQCLRLAAKVHEKTSGAFDVTLGEGMNKLVFGVEEISIGVTAPVQLDLGAIGKGFALDQAAVILAEWKIGRALLNAGTSTVLAIGEGWEVGIGSDWGQRLGMEKIVLNNESLSGSGTEVQGPHILDPRSRRPASSHLAAWALAPSAALSDALSTAFFVMGTAEVRQFCATHPGVEALVVKPRRGLLRLLQDKLVASSGMLNKISRAD